jgi:hypothetical protein
VYPTVSGRLIVVAPSSSAICSTSAVNSTSARSRPSGRLHVVAQRLRVGDGGARLALDVLARGLQLVLDVDVRRRDERVDARALARRVPPPRRVDVGRRGARQAGDHRAVDLAGDRLHGLEVAGRRDREAGLDDVDAQARELVGDLELLAVFSEMPGDCSPSRSVVSKIRTRSAAWPCRRSLSAWSSALLGWVCGFAAATRYSPRRGRR